MWWHYQSLRKKFPFCSYSDPHFKAFRLNAERYSISLCILVRMLENTDQNNSEHRHFLHVRLVSSESVSLDVPTAQFWLS